METTLVKTCPGCGETVSSIGRCLVAYAADPARHRCSANALCPVCGHAIDQPASAINRARRRGAPIYCGRVCAGLARRSAPISDAERRANKAAYDVEYRRINVGKITAQKAAWHKANYDPTSAAIFRKENMQRHVEYCRQPEYKKKKHLYDVARGARLSYGEFAEVALTLKDLMEAINDRSTDYERRLDNETGNKTQRRGRSTRSVGR